MQAPTESLNAYSYVEGRPTFATDPLGLEAGPPPATRSVTAAVSGSAAFGLQGIQSTFSGALLGGYVQVSFGIVRTRNGQIGATFTYGGGGTTAVVGLSGGVGPIFSNARAVSDYGGVFGEFGGALGTGVGGSLDVAIGTTADGYVVAVVTPQTVVGSRGLTF